MSALRVEQLSKRYGSSNVLHGVSLTVPSGSLFGLLGLNGAGKTTTLHCALGLLRPTSGRCEILGVPASEIHRTRGRIGVLFDAPTNYSQLTVRENLELTCVMSGIRSGRMPADVERLVDLHRGADRRAKKLSFGMQRRLGIARALLGSPELVIMDEPLSGLDAEGVDTVLDLARQLHREAGTTFVLLSHRLHELETIVTDVALVHEGRVVAAGPLASLLAAEQSRLLVRADRPQEARIALAACPEVERAELEADGRIALALRGEPSRVNRWLLGRGFDVHELTPIKASLYEFFRKQTKRPAP
ncbi:MAG: ABC transporter ATP-binding protein [Planctomycetota bacterium]